MPPTFFSLVALVVNRTKLRRMLKKRTRSLAAHRCGRVRTWNLHRRQSQGYLTGDSRFQLGTLGDKQRAERKFHSAAKSRLRKAETSKQPNRSVCTLNTSNALNTCLKSIFTMIQCWFVLGGWDRKERRIIEPLMQHADDLTLLHWSGR